MGQENGKVKSYEDLQVWKVSVALAKDVYEVTSSFPDAERFGLTSQMRRASVSIPTNISEGWGRGPGAANLNFVRTARGSLYELKTLIILAKELNFGDRTTLEKLLSSAEDVRRLIHAYLLSMNGSSTHEDIAAYPQGVQ